jgi:nucleoside-diphosphate kinase
MPTEKTFAIVKPDAVEKNHIGGILSIIEKSGLRIRAMRMMHMTRPIAEGFYAVHRERKFFPELVEFMTRGPCVVMVLEGEGAIAKWRELMGATDPAKAAAGTVRKLYGANVGDNATHGSDAPETAKFEIGWFFPGYDV